VLPAAGCRFHWEGNFALIPVIPGQNCVSRKLTFAVMLDFPPEGAVSVFKNGFEVAEYLKTGYEMGNTVTKISGWH
jgi:hypothetical protein